MADQVDGIGARSQATNEAGDYRLRRTTEALNDWLGLYLSEEQQRGLATGLLVGVALGAAILTWGVVASVRRWD
ncbi:MAG: hypothetical protein GEU90_04445 [Gemmatimonas sp.]|nr:hypothetical protein [Gemmatimonas sp.]